MPAFVDRNLALAFFVCLFFFNPLIRAQAAEATSTEVSPERASKSWQAGWLPGYYQITASGLDGSKSGYDFGLLTASFMPNSKNEIEADITLPLESSNDMPGLFLMHVQLERYLRSESKTTLQALLGVIYFAQSLPRSEQNLAYKHDLSFLTSMTSPYVGAKVRSPIGQDTALIGEFHLVPVLPIADNLFSMTEEISAGVEQKFGRLTGVVRADWGRYDVQDRDLGDLNSTYLSIHVGGLCSF